MLLNAPAFYRLLFCSTLKKEGIFPSIQRACSKSQQEQDFFVFLSTSAQIVCASCSLNCSVEKIASTTFQGNHLIKILTRYGTNARAEENNRPEKAGRCINAQLFQWLLFCFLIENLAFSVLNTPNTSAQLFSTHTGSYPLQPGECPGSQRVNAQAT